MTEQIMEAYLAVERAMRNYNDILEKCVVELQANESAETTKLERMLAGSKAMRDSSGIYLAYAKFVAYGMPDSEELIEEDLQT